METEYLPIMKEPRPKLLKLGYVDPKHTWSCAREEEEGAREIWQVLVEHQFYLKF